jgi:type IV secretory pathway TrbD component
LNATISNVIFLGWIEIWVCHSHLLFGATSSVAFLKGLLCTTAMIQLWLFWGLHFALQLPIQFPETVTAGLSPHLRQS